MRLLVVGEKTGLLEIAGGQESLALVLGGETALRPAARGKALEAAKANDSIVRLQVTGSGRPGEKSTRRRREWV